MNYKAQSMISWDKIEEQDILLEVDKLGSLEVSRLRWLLQKFGIGLVRPFGIESSPELLIHLSRCLGHTLTDQNGHTGPYKEIFPAEGVTATTGDSSDELGPHVDGTQHSLLPALLIFQYLVTAQYGAMSQFWDFSSFLLSKPERQRSRLINELSAADAASFRKKGMEHIGPILERNASSYSLRLRFDSVIEVKAELKKDFAEMKDYFQSPGLEFLPRPGDLVVFDNRRLLHARTQVHGARMRRHRRVWIGETETSLPLGIRIPNLVYTNKERTESK